MISHDLLDPRQGPGGLGLSGKGFPCRKDGSVSGPRMRPARAPQVETVNLSELKLGILGSGVPKIAGRGKGKPLGGGSSSPPSNRAGSTISTPPPLRPSFVTNLTKKNDFPVTLAF